MPQGRQLTIRVRIAHFANKGVDIHHNLPIARCILRFRPFNQESRHGSTELRSNDLHPLHTSCDRQQAYSSRVPSESFRREGIQLGVVHKTRTRLLPMVRAKSLRQREQARRHSWSPVQNLHRTTPIWHQTAHATSRNSLTTCLKQLNRTNPTSTKPQLHCKMQERHPTRRNQR